LIEALAIINKASLLVGVDNGLMHLAACGENGTPIVGGYTTINPEYRDLPNLRESIEPDEELSCRFCQSKYNFAFLHDFRTCMYGDLKCVSQMTAGKFIKASAKVLNESVE
jgi:ADP-heptose:LPS heptosyltransferase